MLTYGPKSQGLLLDEGGSVPTGALGLLPGFTLVAQYCDGLVLDPQESLAPIPLIPGNYDGRSESADLFVGELGHWQEYRQALTVKARFVVDQLQSLETFTWPSLCPNYLATATDIDDSNTTDSRLLNVCSPSLHLPYTASSYFRSIQDEIYSHVVSIVLDARALLQFVLSTVRNEICFASIVIGVLCAKLSSPLLFCSVRWEKRRWFIFHGARPPKSVQAMWACLPEACSRSALA